VFKFVLNIPRTTFPEAQSNCIIAKCTHSTFQMQQNFSDSGTCTGKQV